MHNALISAIRKNHPDHAHVDAWLDGKEFATCPISPFGFPRRRTHALSRCSKSTGDGVDAQE